MRFKKKKAELTEEQKEEIRIKDFFDRILPSTIRPLRKNLPCSLNLQTETM